MHTLALVALVAVGSLWAVAFTMWVLGLPRSEARGPGAAAPAQHSDRR